MTISAEIILDSINTQGDRLTTMQLRYPRFIHAEFMTHRVFSRNASSSRAIPVATMIKSIQNDPAVPIHWGKNKPGMQAKEEHDDLIALHEDRGSIDFTKEQAWFAAMESSLSMAKAFADAGYHKQIINRLTEPFQHINVVVSATEWSNFYALRCHEDAQPEMRALADEMFAAQHEAHHKNSARMSGTFLTFMTVNESRLASMH